MRFSASERCNCCASVLATTKSTPGKFSAIMLFTALQPPPPTPNTVIRGVKSVCNVFWIVRFKVICSSPQGDIGKERVDFMSNTIFEKIDEAAEPSASALGIEIDILHGLTLAGREGEQPGQGCEVRRARGIRQPDHAARPAEPHIALQNLRRQLTHAAQLRSAARQHDARAAGAAKA